MLKLNAGFSRKVGEPGYSSRGASVNVELELEGGLINDPDALTARIRKLFEIARHSVEAELNEAAASSNGQTANAPAPQQSAPTTGQQPGRTATSAQVGAIRAICKQLQTDSDQTARERFGVNIEQLNLQQASQLIDQLKARQSSGARQ